MRYVLPAIAEIHRQRVAQLIDRCSRPLWRLESARGRLFFCFFRLERPLRDVTIRPRLLSFFRHHKMARKMDKTVNEIPFLRVTVRLRRLRESTF